MVGGGAAGWGCAWGGVFLRLRRRERLVGMAQSRSENDSVNWRGSPGTCRFQRRFRCRAALPRKLFAPLRRPSRRYDAEPLQRASVHPRAPADRSPRLSARGGYRHSDQRISRGPEQHRPDPQNYARDPLHRRAPRCMIWEGSRLLVSLI
jgi:hypothetical protein